jgi:hypothetical protein
MVTDWRTATLTAWERRSVDDLHHILGAEATTLELPATAARDAPPISTMTSELDRRQGRNPLVAGSSAGPKSRYAWPGITVVENRPPAISLGRGNTGMMPR